MVAIFYKNYRFLYFLLIFFATVFLQAQDKKTISDIEKIYLHTDRTIYFIGEDLWYKAYNTRASNNLLFDNSKILYVELISADSKIIARNKTNLEMGLGHGDFQLQDSLGVKPGIYQLRAYTNWNRNFGSAFVFKKEIEIIDVFDNHSKYNKEKNSVTAIKPETIAFNKQDFFKVDFFPEGGSLIENVTSVIGFKAVDSNGKPIEIKGKIYDSDNELITSFESVHDGMGKLQMMPIEGKKYYAKVKSTSGQEIKVELPNISKQGYLVSFKIIKDRNIISINTNQTTLTQNPNQVLTVDCKIKGISYLETKQTLTETTLSFELPKDKTPEGICKITLLDNTNKPQSERLVYIEKNHDLDVQLETDQESYLPNEEVIINVSSTTKAGIAKAASFSISVTDTNGIEDSNFESNICSYFLMESDIRGKIHNPGYYFDINNSKRLEHLDNLLLTQGWRDFVWKSMPKVYEINPYKVEKGITISGRVKQLFSEKPLINSNLTLTLMDQEKLNIFNTTSDSIGLFQFENLLFAGMINMYLSTTNEKGKFRGEIVLNPVEEASIPVLLKKESMDLVETTNLVTKNVLKKYTALGVNPENMLKEVKVKAKSNGLYEYSFVVDKKEANKFYNFLDYLNAKLRANVPKISESGMLYTLIIDNYLMEDVKQLFSLSPEEVIKVEVVSGEALKAIYKQSTVVTIFTSITNGGQRIKTDPMYFIKKRIAGLHTARIFYSPDLENTDIKIDNMTKMRNTIYWNPNIHPDETGNAAINYYNTNVETKVKVALEGVTGSGTPVVKKAYYTIKK